MAVETPPSVETPMGAAPRPTPVPGAEVSVRPSGPAAAAILAAGIGALTLGIVTTLNEAFASFHAWLQFNDRVGPLSGKTILATAAFFGAWGLLTALWRRSNPALRPLAVATAVLVILGLVGTFPTFFLVFASE